jgi:ABC-2 type transport system permease protein
LASLDTPLTAIPRRAVSGWRMLPSRVLTFCLVELRRIQHDRTELYTRAIQPVLWLLVYGETFTRIHAIPTGNRPYIDFLAPGIMAQSALFIAIFYGIQIIWERDAGMLTKLLVTPTPRAALITGKAFAAGVRGLSQVIVILALSAVLRVELDWNPLHLIAAALAVVISAGFFACLSMVLAGIVMSRDRLMGIGQAITMPLFFASSALYPISLMPGWARAITVVNPLTYEVEALRGLLIGAPTDLALDFGVLIFALVVGIIAAASLLGRLGRG